MRVSSREVTLLDLVAFPNKSGAIYNVATVVGEMLSEGAINIAKLADAGGTFPVSVVQRTGWLIDYMAERIGATVDTTPLLRIATSRSTPTPLDPNFGRRGTLDPRWNVLVYEYPDTAGFINSYCAQCD